MAELDKIYEENKGKYKVLKDILIEDIKTFISPIRERRNQLEKNKDSISEILKKGGEKAKSKTETKLLEIKKKIGVY